MKIKFNNLYTHFVFTTLHREPVITEKHRERVEKFINENKLSKGNFKWQTSGSAFSVSKRDVDKVCKYILNQKEHHKTTTYKEEYDKFIKFYEKTIKPSK